MKPTNEDLQKTGYWNQPVDSGLDLFEEIKRLKKEKNAVILAHYYQNNDIQDIADFIGDSLGLAQEAEKQKLISLCLPVFILWRKQLSC